MPATYTKLRDGSWGVRVTGNRPSEGQPVDVTKKDRSVKREMIGKVLFSGDGFHLCTIQNSDNPPAGKKRFSQRKYNRDDEACDLCGNNKYTCGHCIGW